MIESGGLERRGRFQYVGFMPRPNFVSILGLIAPLLLPATAIADDFVGTFGDWHVQTYEEGGAKVCLMWSQPTKAEGDYTQRGEVYAYVTHRPARQRLNEVSLSMGYPLKKDGVLDIIIGEQKYALFTQGDTAWNRTPAEDEKMVAAMKAGATLIARGVSSRGTRTTDTYSLGGFTKAHAATSKACGVK